MRNFWSIDGIRQKGKFLLFFSLEQLFLIEQLWLINFSKISRRSLRSLRFVHEGERNKIKLIREGKGSGLDLILSIDSEIEYRYRVLISFCYIPVIFFLFFFFFFRFWLLLHNRSIWQTFLIVFRRCSQLLFRVNTDINNLNFTYIGIACNRSFLLFFSSLLSRLHRCFLNYKIKL